MDYTEMIYLCIDVVALVAVTWGWWAFEKAPWSWQKALFVALAVALALAVLVGKDR